jgi:Family of unknown function (DUF6009)
MNYQSQHLEDETKITWLEEPRQFPYLRERVEHLASRSRFPLGEWRGSKTHRLVGYSEVSVLAQSIYDGFYRRIWWFKIIPPDPYPKGCPGEAVKPPSVKAGVPSETGRE